MVGNWNIVLGIARTKELYWLRKNERHFSLVVRTYEEFPFLKMFSINVSLLIISIIIIKSFLFRIDGKWLKKMQVGMKAETYSRRSSLFMLHAYLAMKRHVAKTLFYVGHFSLNSIQFN